jgi:hypothetical protein
MASIINGADNQMVTEAACSQPRSLLTQVVPCGSNLIMTKSAANKI